MSAPQAARTLLSGIRRYPLLAVVVVALLAVGVSALLGAWPAARWIATGAAALVVVVQAVRMLRDLRAGRWGLDVLAILAIGSTLLVGDYGAALIVALMLTGGEALEDYASERARDRLRALLAGAPRRAHRLGTDGALEDVDVDAVEVGDVVVVRPSEVVPVDGVLLDDEAEFDESSLTGESLPVLHRAGGDVLSGSVGGGTAVRVRASRRAAESQYQQIVRLVESAAASRGRFVRLADRLALPFTVVSLAIAGVAWALSGDPVRFAEVLVVATPCPLLIAAPVAFVAGMGRAAKDGVVLKNGESLERLAHPVTVAFDKTGTLTGGRPEVVRVEPLPGLTPDETLALAAGLEQHSGHVLAQSIARAAQSRGLVPATVDDLREVTARGVHGVADGQPVRAGRWAFVTDRDPADEPRLEPGEMAVHLARGGGPPGRIVLRDEVRPEAAATVVGLRAEGARHVVMLTGDSLGTARHIAAAVGITELRAGLLPADKVRIVAALAERPVLMVGDGVNDAPVLAAADVGVAMGARGATAASESADVVVLADDLGRVLSVVRTARRTVRIARQSAALGIGLSIVFMLVAATGVLPAFAGALVQEAIDVATIANGLRAARRAPHR